MGWVLLAREEEDNLCDFRKNRSGGSGGDKGEAAATGAKNSWRGARKKVRKKRTIWVGGQ